MMAPSWIQILIIVILPSLWVLPIALADKEKRLNRSGYAIRTISLVIIGFVAIALTRESVVPEAIIMLLGVPLHALWSVHRTQDAQLNKWLNLIQIIPLVGLALWVFLLFKKGNEAVNYSPA